MVRGWESRGRRREERERLKLGRESREFDERGFRSRELRTNYRRVLCKDTIIAPILGLCLLEVLEIREPNRHHRNDFNGLEKSIREHFVDEKVNRFIKSWRKIELMEK
jgi:hypothetical protein